MRTKAGISPRKNGRASRASADGSASVNCTCVQPDKFASNAIRSGFQAAEKHRIQMKGPIQVFAGLEQNSLFAHSFADRYRIANR